MLLSRAFCAAFSFCLKNPAYCMYKIQQNPKGEKNMSKLNTEELLTKEKTKECGSF